MKTLLFWIIDCWRLIMDNRFNPLRHIKDPSIQGYFTVVLFIMWSCYFGIVALYYMSWLGYSIVTSIWVHMAVIIPIMITNVVFRNAEKNGGNWVSDYRREQEWKKIYTPGKRKTNGSFDLGDE